MSKGGNGIFDVRNDDSQSCPACCTHEGEADRDVSAQVLTENNNKKLLRLYDVTSMKAS